MTDNVLPTDQEPAYQAFAAAFKALMLFQPTIYTWGAFQQHMQTALDRTTGGQYSLPAFVQRNPRFVEGSMPQLWGGPDNLTEDGANMNAILQLMLGLDPRTLFKVAMDGAVQTGGGLIWLNAERGYAHMLVVKGDIYNKGKVGVIGGQGSDRDRGDSRKTMLRETGEEIGNFPFDKDRLFHLMKTHEWRETDSRGAYAIWSDFDVYLATDDETQALQAGYAKHVKATGGDPEIQGIKPFTRREVLEHIRDGRMGYFDQTQAFVMTNLIIGQLRYMPNHVQVWEQLSKSQQWLMTKALVMDVFAALTTSASDWRPRIDPDDMVFGLNT